MNPIDTIPHAGRTPVVGVPHPPPLAAADDADDTVADIRLLEWISSQVPALQAKPGQHVLGTDGRILGVGDDPDELYRRVIAAEPALASARLVDYRVTDDNW